MACRALGNMTSKGEQRSQCNKADVNPQTKSGVAASKSEMTACQPDIKLVQDESTVSAVKYWWGEHVKRRLAAGDDDVSRKVQNLIKAQEVT